MAPESKKLVLSSAASKWRQFKSKLTSKYVLPFAGRKKKLKKPPKMYHLHWKEFVASRLSNSWPVYVFFYFFLLSYVLSVVVLHKFDSYLFYYFDACSRKFIWSKKKEHQRESITIESHGRDMFDWRKN